MIYLLKRLGDIQYDEYSGKVVRAASEREAREIANRKTGDEGTLWEDAGLVACELIEPDGESAELLGSFHAG